MPKKVLIVDDEKAIVDILKFNLVREGYETAEAYDGEDGYNKVLSEKPDLILLDVMLPNMPGFDVCRKVREKSNVPIIMLTARTDEIDKVLGLELGADDYITKPFGIREVMARVKANLRRNSTEQSAEEKKADSNLTFGALTIDTERYEASKNGKVVELTLREFELLKFLAIQPEKIFSRETLLEKVWGYEYLGDVRTVDVTVRRLREKIEDDASNPAFVMTKRGIGYYFNSKQKG
ncbi:MAG: response regulator transcription factor [Clostridia bacterium]|nr:response regulator transcription factor [Clostridia bacterium]